MAKAFNTLAVALGYLVAICAWMAEMIGAAAGLDNAGFSDCKESAAEWRLTKPGRASRLAALVLAIACYFAPLLLFAFPPNS